MLASLKERFPAASIMTTFHEMGVTAAETDRDAQRWAEVLDLVNSAKEVGRAGNPNYSPNDRFNEQAKDGNAGQAAGNSGNSLLQQQLDFAYRVKVNVGARRESQKAYIYDDNRAIMPLGLGGGVPGEDRALVPDRRG